MTLILRATGHDAYLRELIDRYGITNIHLVPTQFVRLLRELTIGLALGLVVRLVLSAVLLAGPAQAQLSPNPGAVNDCTLLTDPTALRRCIERQQGVTTYSETPPPRSDVSRMLKRERDYYRHGGILLYVLRKLAG